MIDALPLPFSITGMRSSSGGSELIADTRDSDGTRVSIGAPMSPVDSDKRPI